MAKHKILFGALAVVFLVVVVLSFAEKPQFGIRPVSPTGTFDAKMHPDARIRGMLHNSCYNCHSEQGEIPVYANFWPASNLLLSDLTQARARLDFSEWDNLSPEMSRIRLIQACEMIRSDKMPVWYYRPMHPGAAVSKEDAEYFCQWAYSQPETPEPQPWQTLSQTLDGTKH